jgi:RNA polymerase sigma factor (TIGR02999 family)
MSTASSGDVTALLLRWNDQKPETRDQLVRFVYNDLRKLAARVLSSERTDHTLQPTALVHETYQKLIDQRRARWQNRAQFFAVAAMLVRRILVDHARLHRALRRGGHAGKLSIAEATSDTIDPPDVDLVALDEALTELAMLDADQARIVELRFFAGLSVPETAEALGISRATVHRDWATARAWLHQRLTG